jgi:Cytochrome c554 and c-prime
VNRARTIASFLSLVGAAFILLLASRTAGNSVLQSTSSSAISLPTEIRLKSPGWWPTKGTASRQDYVGSDVCFECHELKSESQQKTAMANAAIRPADSKALREHDRLSFQSGPFHYEISTQNSKSILSVGDGSSLVSADLLWSFGSGHMGQTFIYQRDAKFYEAHVSYFSGSQELNVTPGQSSSVPSDLASAAGRLMSDEETQHCFGCHTTESTLNNRFEPLDPVPGVACEQCHGPGSKHVAAARAHTEKRGSGLILNPARFERVDSVDFCGACHRTWQDIMSNHMSAAGVLNVRFAPYRLENSRCWAEGDARITCIACHDPHKPLVHDLSSYDSNCLQCHLANSKEKKTSLKIGAACPVATQNCVSCHMPKVSPPTLHSTFTDHWIRIARAKDPYPE